MEKEEHGMDAKKRAQAAPALPGNYHNEFLDGFRNVREINKRVAGIINGSGHG